MASGMFCVPDFIEAGYGASFSGGSWEATLPLTNLRTRQLSEGARSTDATTANTQFEVDLGAEYYVRVWAIPRHNLSRAATVRIRGSNSAGSFGSPVYDSTALDVFPVIYPSGVLPFGHPAAWDGKLTQAELDAGYQIGFTHVADTPQSARYWLIEIDDTANADGYVDLGRLVVSFAWQPTYAFATGAKMGWETSSSRTETPGGSFIHRDRPRRRRFDLTVQNLGSDEALVFAFDLARKYGTSGQIYFIFDPDDEEHMHRRAFLATLRELSPLDVPYHAAMTPAFALVEEL